MHRALAALSVVMSLAACQPEPPEKERPPVPQADAAAAGDATELRDAIQAPIDRARTTEQAVQDAAEAQRAAIEAAD